MSRTPTRITAAAVATATLALAGAPSVASADSVAVGGSAQITASGDLGVAARVARSSATKAERLVRRSEQRLHRAHRLAVRAAQSTSPRAQAQVAVSLSGSAADQVYELTGIVLRERGRVQRAAASALIGATAAQASVTNALADRLADTPGLADAVTLEAVARLSVEQVDVLASLDAAIGAPRLERHLRRALVRGLQRALVQRAALERAATDLRERARAEVASDAQELEASVKRGSDRLRDLLAGSSVEASVVVDSRVAVGRRS